MGTSQLVTKSVRLSAEEEEKLKQISQEEGVSEAAVIKRFVLRGIGEHRLEKAIVAYERGEADLGASAKFAGVSVYHMMTELEKRDITPPAAAEKLMDGLRTLVETFGSSNELRQTIVELEGRE